MSLMQAQPRGEHRSDRLRVGDQTFVFERQLRLGAIPVGHHDSRQVLPVADFGTALEGETCAVGWAIEGGIELQFPGLDDAQAGLAGNLDEAMAAHIETPEKMPASDLIVSLTGPYVAGLDTVANTTSAVVYCVLKHPEVKERVLKEVDELFAAGDLDEQALLNKLPALNGAIMGS